MATGRRIASIGLFVAAFFLQPILAAGQGTNLLKNGGFEEKLSAWNAAEGHSLPSEAAAAHSGKQCLTGTITEANRALFLSQPVSVKAGHRYLFEVWARATNRTKLVFRTIPPGAKRHELVAAWENVTPQWRKYTSPLQVGKDGKLEVMLVAPSSHGGAPPGQIWIDDLALYEIPVPPATPVSDGNGFNDEPAIARTDDGSIYVAWNSFRDGADSLQLARFKPQGKKFQRLDEWQVLAGKGTYVLGIRAVGTGASAVIVYASEQEKNWDIFAVTCGSDGPEPPTRITSHGSVDVKPAAAWRHDTLWTAWESNRNGARQIFAAPLKDGNVGRPVEVSRPDMSCYDPSIAVLESGEVCVAWHGFQDGNYDIYLRRMAADRSWRSERRLTTSPAVDRHAVLAARGNQLWLVYENARFDGKKPYRIGSTVSRNLIVSQVTPDGLLAPKASSANSPLSTQSEAASAAFDDAGRLWLSYLRRTAAKATGWEAFATCLTAAGWKKPGRVSVRKGMDRRAVFALDGNKAVVAYQADDLPRAWWKNIDESLKSTSDIFLATVELDPPPVGMIELEPLVEQASESLLGPADSPALAQLRLARGEDTPTPSIDYQGRELKLFFGDLHEHSDVSICGRTVDQSINESYQHMRDLVSLDFACVTDHGFNLNPYLWAYTAKLARVNDDSDRFLTFLGEEWTSQFKKTSAEHPFGYYGHRNLILADPYFPRWWNGQNAQTPAQLWEDLRKLNANFVNIPHQLADTGCIPTDWNFTDEEAQPVAEIFQIRGSYEFKGTPREAGRTTPGPGYFLQDAWARGIVIGVIASPDHGGGYGKACVYAAELTREAILDALRRRHCFGTTAARIFLDVRVDGHLMGEKIAQPAGKAVEIKVAVRCPADIGRIEVCRNNKFIYTKAGTGRSAQFTFTDRAPLPGQSYYYVRVMQKDGEIAWSSPVWLGAK